MILEVERLVEGQGQPHGHPCSDLGAVFDQDGEFVPVHPRDGVVGADVGLEPLADLLLTQPQNEPAASAAAFVSADKNVADAAAALEGAAGETGGA